MDRTLQLSRTFCFTRNEVTLIHTAPKVQNIQSILQVRLFAITLQHQHLRLLQRLFPGWIQARRVLRIGPEARQDELRRHLVVLLVRFVGLLGYGCPPAHVLDPRHLRVVVRGELAMVDLAQPLPAEGADGGAQDEVRYEALLCEWQDLSVSSDVENGVEPKFSRTYPV